MDLILGLIIIAAIIGVGLMVGQILLGILIYVVVGLIMLVTLPFTWLYNKIKGVK